MSFHENLAWLFQPKADQALKALHAGRQLEHILPEVEALYGVPQNAEHHPEICTGIHTELCLKMAETIGASDVAKFAVLVHDLGKALTPKDELPKHVDHEHRGLVPVKAVCDRLSAPTSFVKVALAVCESHLHAHRAFEMRSKSMLKFVDGLALKKDSAFAEDFLKACEADKRGRLGKEDRPYRQGAFLREVVKELNGLPDFISEEQNTREWQDWHNARLAAVRRARARFADA